MRIVRGALKAVVFSRAFSIRVEVEKVPIEFWKIVPCYAGPFLFSYGLRWLRVFNEKSQYLVFTTFYII